MPTAEWIRGASFEEVWAQVIDPLLVQALGDPDGSSMAGTAADLITLWVLQSAACRSGIESFVAEEPAWMAARVAPAARALGHDELAALWEQATRGVDLAAYSGNFEVPFASQAAVDELGQALVTGAASDLPRELVARVQRHAEEFAR